MDDRNVILSFKGEFTPELLTSILHIMEIKMSNLQLESKKKKRVFNVMVECFQNLYHHIEEVVDDDEDKHLQKSALIIVKHAEDKIIIRTGNHVSNADIKQLKERLGQINELDQDHLREEYRKKLLNNSMSDKGTAGLGLIDIARKSKNKLGYEFIQINERKAFFCLNIVIE